MLRQKRQLLVFVFFLGSTSVMQEAACSLEREITSEHANIQEFCTAEEPYIASCLKNEVIVMTSAVYGRMRMGNCLEDEGGELFRRNMDDPKFLGCSEDVLKLMDNKCSGNQQCEVRLMSDSDFRKIKPCHTTLKLYLEASYQCITVVESDRSCNVVAQSNPLHIMRSRMTSQNCGTQSQPWLIEAPVGQQINVSLLVFGAEVMQTRNSCNRHGFVIEKTANVNVSICGHNEERNMMIYKSRSNHIEVILDVTTNEADLTEQERIVIGFYAIGCSNVVPPEDAWLRRNGSEATVGCYSSRQAWLLRCVGNQWLGVIGNCTQVSALELVIKTKSTSSNLNQVTIMVMVAFMTLIFCLIIICCGAVCLKRHYSQSARKHIQLIEENNKKFSTEDRQMQSKPMLPMNGSLILT